MKDGNGCLRIFVTGLVQGVGFRPFIYTLATQMSLKGFVVNTSEGVIINAEGKNLERFIERIRAEAPPLARITAIDIAPAEPCGYRDFAILESRDEGRFTLISPDVAVCSDCIKEVFDSTDRRYLYPFTNCTNCGPRYSITRSVPYDRMNTTMNVFTMCSDCSAEYHNPSDRRFHAQPNACPKCGPSLAFKVQSSKFKAENNISDHVASAIKLLKQGAIVAVKGLGGFHLACDASNKEAVERLRERKRRSNKPFALMSPDVQTIKKYCFVADGDEALLESPSRPIVLMRKREEVSLPDAVAPKNSYLGFMLPYTPLHYLLFRFPGTPGFEALVMTSANLSEEPIVISNSEAMEKLSGIADAFLFHNRDIFMRVDDSVIKLRTEKSELRSKNINAWYLPDPSQLSDSISQFSVPNSQFSFIRRSRGYAPGPILLKDDGPDVLGCGADIKNTFTITKGRYAVISQHIGDMENYETLRFFEETLTNLKAVYRAEPVAIVHDLHPRYLSTQWALSRCRNDGTVRTDAVAQVPGFNDPVPCYGIQHHYAHIASVMAEHGLKEKVIGVAFDGSGYGEDGTLWGGEFLIADIAGFKRAGHIRYIPLPGGETAIREPWRISVSYLKETAGREVWDYLKPTGFIEKYGEALIDNILKISENKQFSPLSSGAGRLFDAVSALIGVCDRNTFEGEAAIALESLVDEGRSEDYPVDISFREVMEIDFSHMILRIIDDMQRNPDLRLISTRFHNTVAAAICSVVLKLSLTHNIRRTVLSGGVFQNSYLLSMVREKLVSEGLAVHLHETVPCNDACISLGQAYIIRERMKAGLL